MNLGTMVVTLAAKVREYIAELGMAATATEAAADKIDKANKTLTESAKDVVKGQADVADTAMQVATRMGPMGGAVAAAAAVVAGYALVSYKAAQENTALVRAMALSGNQAGVTAGQLQSMAAAAGQVVGTHGQAAQAIGAMVGSGKVAAENLQALTVTALNASRSLGVSVEETVKNYNALGAEPVKASLKLNETLGYLTEGTYKRIKALEEMGKKDEAAALAQQTYSAALDAASKKAEGSLGLLQKAWRALGDTASKAWDAVLNIGREDTLIQKLEKQRAAVNAAEEQIAYRQKSGMATGDLDKQAAALRNRLEVLQLQDRAEMRAAESVRQSSKYHAQRVDILAQLSAAEQALMTNRQKLAKATEGYDALMKEGLMDRAERNRLVAAAEEKYADKVVKSAAAVDKMTQARKDELKVGELRNKLVQQAFEDEQKALAAVAANSRAYTDSLDKQVQAAHKAVEAAQWQLDTFGLSKSAIAELTLAKLEDAKAQVLLSALTLDDVRAIEAKIEVQKRLIDINKRIEGKEAVADNNKTLAKRVADFAKEAERVAQKIEDSLTDALMRGFESGKGFAANLVDTVANMFKTLVLRPIVSAVVNPVAGAITGSLGLTGTANAASGAGNLLGVGGLYNSFATSGVGSALGLSVPMVDVLGTGAAGNIMSGLGSSLGSAIPWIGGILAIGSLLKSLDDSGTFHTGGASTYSAATGASNINSMTLGTAAVVDSSKTQAMTSGMVQSIVGILDSTATTFGKSAGYAASTAFSDDASRDGAWGALVIQKGGQTLLDWAATRTSKWAPKEFADGEAGAGQYASAVAVSIRDLLIAETPEWADTMLRALGDAPTLEQLGSAVQAINSAQAALVTMGDAATSFAGLSESATAALVKALGGAEGTVARLDSYYGNFFSEAERASVATAQLTTNLAALGVALPASREEFRALVDGALSSGNTGLAAGLINLSSAFASVVPATQNAVAAIDDTAADMARAAQRIASERAGLEREWLQTTGNTAGLRALDLAALDASNRAMQEQIWAYQDQAAAQQLATEAAQQAAQAAQQAAEAYASAYQEAQAVISSAAMNIGQWLDAQNASTGNRTQDLASAGAAFQRQLAMARGGDRDALSGIMGYADRLISSGEQRLGWLQGQQLIAQTKQQLVGLPAQLRPEQFIVNAVNASADSIGASVAAASAAQVAATNALGAGYAAALQPVIATLGTGFAAMDTNASRTLDLSEFSAALAGKATDAEIQRLFALIDTDNDRLISAAEATRAAALTFGQQVKAGLAADFATLDTTLNGTLSLAEFSAGFAGLATEETLRAAFVAIDTNGDGVITRLEAIAASTAATATGVTNGNLSPWLADKPLTAVWAADDPIRSVFTAIRESTGWLVHIHAYMGAIHDLQYQQYDQAVNVSNYLNGIVNGTFAATVRSSNQGGGSLAMFARGGAFTNRVVSTPTMFPMGVMGESGDEAVMPLANIGGSLGVRYAGPDFDSIARAMQALTAEFAAFRRDHAAVPGLLNDLKTNTRSSEQHLGRMRTDGVPVHGVEAGDNAPPVKMVTA